MMKILITAPYSQKAIQQLTNSQLEIFYKPWKPHGRTYNEGELIGLLNETQADALITEHDQITARIINAHPHLQFIGVCRGTPSNIDIQATTDAGIPVFFTPARNAQAVAEMFIANVITFLRNTIESIEWLKSGEWGNGAHTSYLKFKGNEIAGKTIGMIGFGAIGQRIAEMVENFPCSIQFYDPYIDSNKVEYRKVDLNTIFSTSDIVSVHLPVTDETTGMIDKTLLSQMKSDAIFVNTARATVVNRHDLLDLLEKKKIRGAIIDVFDNEPPDQIDNRIIHLPNVMATPHIAGATHEVEDHHADIMNEAILQWLQQEKINPGIIVNKEVIVSKVG